MTRPSQGWTIATSGAVLFVLVCTLFPFAIDGSSPPTVRELLWIRIGPEMGRDVATNLLLFVPFGFALAGQLQRRRVTAPAAMLAVLAISLGLSYGVEVVQRFLPTRVTSMSDVVSNGAGGLLGFICYRVWALEDTGLNVAAYMLSATLASLPLQWSTTVRDWDADFPLIVGNERTGDRPWQGRVFDVAILDRALSEGEVSRVYETRVTTPWESAVVASYDLTGSTAFRDRSGHLAPLVWRAGADEATENEIRHAAHSWLETSGPAASVVDRVKESSRFTLVVTAAASDTDQRGPARIVSMSSDPDRRNFTLGQDGAHLIFRLRNTLTGENGDNPALVVPAVFATTETRHLVITYDGVDLIAYIDGARAAQAIRFGLGAPAFARVLGRNPRAFRVYDVLYYAIVFVPAGALIALGGAGRRRQVVWMPALSAAVMGSAVALETMLVVASGRVFSMSNVFWSVSFAAAGVTTCELIRSRRSRVRHSTSNILN